MVGTLLLGLVTFLGTGDPGVPKDIPRSGIKVPGQEPMDEMMQGFMESHNVPGAVLAVSRNGKLVYSAGFGWTEKPDDASKTKGQPVQTDTLFRIASISKPITAVAILHLAEKKKLNLSDKLLDHIHFQPLPGQQMDPRWKEITLDHLLHHTGGFDRNKSFDPMFRSIEFAEKAKVTSPASDEIVIRNMLGKPLDFPPGERYAYSNFGYCLLGRVIESCSGKDYESFVKKEVLAPAGIHGMVIGKTKAEQRLPKESHYFDGENRQGKSVFPPHGLVPRPYGTWYHESLDAHGGWVGTAEDLVHFADHLNWDHPHPLLARGSLEIMRKKPTLNLSENNKTEPEKKEPDKKPWYGCGWQYREVSPGKWNAWHTGLVPGSSAILVRRHDGFNWAVIFNSQGPDFKNNLAVKIDPLVHKAVNSVKEWPK